MGANYSRQVVDSTTEIVQNVMNSISNEVDAQTIINSYLRQNAEIKAVGANLRNCRFTITQDASNTALAFGDTNNALTNKLENELKAKLNEIIEQKLTQLNKDLNLGQFNIGDVISRTRTYISQNLSTYIKNGIRLVVQTNGVTDQSARIDLSGANCVGSVTEINQKGIMNLMAKNISQNIVDNTVKNSAVADVEKKISQDISQTNAGLNLAIGGLIFILIAVIVLAFTVLKTFLQSPAGKILMVVVVLLILAALGYFIYKRTRPDIEKIRK